MKIQTEKNALLPNYRYALRVKMLEAGYKTLNEFAREVDCNISQISRIVNGWELPSPRLQQRISDQLNLTREELREIL